MACARFDPAGRKILTASIDGTAKLWTAEGRLLATLKHDGPVIYADFGLDGRLVVTAAEDHTARVWETEHGTPVTPPLRHDGRVVHAALSPDGTLVATASHDVNARIWPVRAGPSAPRVLKHDLPVTCVAFNCDGSRLATGSHDATVRIWDPATGKPLGPPLRHEGGVLGIAFDPDGNRIATCSDDNTARLLGHGNGRASDGTAQARRQRPVRRYRPAGTLRPHGKYGRNRPSLGSRARTQQRVDREVSASKTTPRDGGEKWWSADRRYYAIADGSHSAANSHSERRAVGALLRHASLVTFAAFSPDGTRLVTTSEDCTARLWDALTGDLLALR